MPLYNPGNYISSVVGVGAAPTIALGAAAGSGATYSIAGDNMIGKITLNVGTGILSSGTVMTMTFANSLSYPTGSSVLFSPANSNFATLQTLLYCTTSQTTVTLQCTTALTVSTTYIGYYLVVGY